MFLEQLRRHVVEPLYQNMCYTNDAFIVLEYSLAECEKRILAVLSMGQSGSIHIYMERFPWRELEELLGEHLSCALEKTRRKEMLAISLGKICMPNIFSQYIRHKRRMFL